MSCSERDNKKAIEACWSNSKGLFLSYLQSFQDEAYHFQVRTPNLDFTFSREHNRSQIRSASVLRSFFCGMRLRRARLLEAAKQQSANTYCLPRRTSAMRKKADLRKGAVRSFVRQVNSDPHVR